jgi:ferrous iron transport protein B
MEKIEIDTKFNPTKTQAEEILQRYTRIRQIMQQHVVETGPLEKKMFTDKLDNLLIAPHLGLCDLIGGTLYVVPEYFLAGTIPDGWDRMDL